MFSRSRKCCAHESRQSRTLAIMLTRGCASWAGEGLPQPQAVEAAALAEPPAASALPRRREGYAGRVLAALCMARACAPDVCHLRRRRPDFFPGSRALFTTFFTTFFSTFFTATSSHRSLLHSQSDDSTIDSSSACFAWIGVLLRAKAEATATARIEVVTAKVVEIEKFISSGIRTMTLRGSR